jgi:catechol 2,3-dioxygenase-like lactoylglutathione lyase family enzyme
VSAAGAFGGTRISGCCLLIDDLDRSVAFYTDKMGLVLHRKAYGFAQYEPRRGVHLSTWQIDYFCEHVGLPRQVHHALHKAMPCVLMSSAAEVDAAYKELSSRGVKFASVPALYPWNAYACYFDDPDGNIWELFHCTSDRERSSISSGSI